jgi:hypothetical protein
MSEIIETIENTNLDENLIIPIEFLNAENKEDAKEKMTALLIINNEFSKPELLAMADFMSEKSSVILQIKNAVEKNYAGVKYALSLLRINI